jgi:hypothetical protein
MKRRLTALLASSLLALALPACGDDGADPAADASIDPHHPDGAPGSDAGDTPGPDAGPGADATPVDPNGDLPHRLVPKAAQYQVTEQQTDGSGLSSTAAGFGQGGFVITAMTTNTAGYTLVGVKPATGAATTYETSVRQTDGSGLSSTAASLGSAGFIVATAATNTAGYTLVGVKPSGAAATYETSVLQTSGSGLSSTAASMASGGFVITAITTNTAGYTLFGVKAAGGATYEASVLQTSGSGLSSTVSSMASGGFVVTAVATNTAGYTIVGVKKSGASASYNADVDQTSGSGLLSLLQGYGTSGLVPSAMVSNTAGYTVVAVSP